MATTRTRDVVVDDVRSPVIESGNPDATEAVLFLHGNPGPSEDFRFLVEGAGDFVRAVAPDMPGYGKADRPATFTYTVEGYAAHLDGIIEQLGLRRLHLVLHDFGGPWGLSWASGHLDRVASITLINIGIVPGYRWHKFARIWRTPVLGELFQLLTTRSTLRFSLNRENPKPFPEPFIDRVYTNTDAGSKRAILALYRASDDLGTASEEWGKKLAPLKLPALVLWGTGDTFLPYRYAEIQRAYFGETDVHLLEGCGHWPFVDDPDRVAALVLPFLRKQVGGSI